MRVPAQGALFFTCQRGRTAVSDSSIQFGHTRHCHGTATQLVGPSCA